MVTKKGTNKDDKLSGTSGDDVLIGLGGNDLLVGLNGDDTLLGGDGNDTLDGKLGNDELLGEDGNDLFLPGGAGSGADAIHGGLGIDTVSFKDITPVVGVSITSGFGSSDTDGDFYLGIENYIGSSGSDFFSFHFDDRVLPGFIYGGKGNDTIAGNGQTIRGDDGSDFLFADFYKTEADRIWLQFNKGADVIYNFDQSNVDQIVIKGSEFGVGRLLNTDEFVIRGSDSNATVADEQFIYRSDNRQLFFDVDGTGTQPAVLIATFGNDPTTTLQLSDFEVI